MKCFIILNGKKKGLTSFYRGPGILMTLPEAFLHTFTGVVIKSCFLKNPQHTLPNHNIILSDSYMDPNSQFFKISFTLITLRTLNAQLYY